MLNLTSRDILFKSFSRYNCIKFKNVPIEQCVSYNYNMEVYKVQDL